MRSINELRLRMVNQAFELGFSHLAGALSALPIVMDIYKDFSFDDDVFIMSKGHASYAQYVVLEDFGYHPDWHKHEPVRLWEEGVYCVTGSLGHGLPVAAGTAYAKKYLGNKGKVHVLLGDGECQEGTIWETLLFVEKQKLDNLSIHIDCNGFQALSETIYPKYVKHLKSFNVNLRLYNKIKGFGIKLFEEHPDWHVHVLTPEETTKIREELTNA